MSDALSSTGILVKRKPTTPLASVAIATSSVADPTVITTSAPHGRTTGDEVTIAGHSGATPAINGTWVVTVIDATTFTIPEAVTVGGTGGTMTPGRAVVAEIRDVNPGGKSRNKIETSTHNEKRESHQLGILRQKDPTFQVNYLADEETHAAVQNDIDNNVKNEWMILFPSGLYRLGQARVQDFEYAGAPVDGVQQATITLSWAGPVSEGILDVAQMITV